MISASDTREFVPHGRDYMSTHPGKTRLHAQGRVGSGGTSGAAGSLAAAKDHGLPLVKALRDFSISVSKVSLALKELFLKCIAYTHVHQEVTKTYFVQLPGM